MTQKWTANLHFYAFDVMVDKYVIVLYSCCRVRHGYVVDGIGVYSNVFKMGQPFEEYAFYRKLCETSYLNVELRMRIPGSAITSSSGLPRGDHLSL